MKHWRWWIALVITLTAITLGLELHGYVICKPDHAGHENCTPHSLVVFLFFNLVDFLDAGSVIITTLSTAAIAFFTLTLWRTTDRLRALAEDQKADFGTSIAIAKAAADAAGKSSDVAEATLVSTQRPWLHFSATSKLHPELSATRLSCRAEMAVHNVGKSPATNLQPWAAFYAVGEIEPFSETEAVIKSKHGPLADLAIQNSRGETLFAEDSTTMHITAVNLCFDASNAGNIVGYFVCGVSYAFTFGVKSPRYFARVYALLDRSRDEGKGEGVPVDWANIEMVPVRTYAD